MKDTRIYITGMGAVTPVGVGVDAYWDGLLSGKCGIGEIEGMDTEAFPVKRAAQVRGFEPKDHLPNRLVMDLEPYMQFAYVSAIEALTASGLDPKSDRVGIVMGTALAGVTTMCATGAAVAAGKRVSPKFLTKAMGNITAAQFAINYGVKGPSMTVTTACSSGGDAISLASLLIRSGQADAMIVMAGESILCAPVIQCLTKTGALSKTGESRPFALNRSGFVLGEGGGAVILESEEHAKARGAKICARLLSCSNTNDAFNPVSPDPEGEGAARCVDLAIKAAGLSPDDVDYINAHGTATHAGDIAETLAVRQIFGERPVFVSSTKGATGHMMGAGGITEVIACIKAIKTGIMPPNTGLTERDPECGLNIVTPENSRHEVKIAMSNAFGFGGQNSCVIVGKV